MVLTSKHVKALLRDDKLKDLLLKNNKLSAPDYEAYDHLIDEKLDIANEEIFGVLEGYAPFQLNFPSPVEQFPNDATIYGTKGIYLVITQDDQVVFSAKREAVKYANDISRHSFYIAKAEGYL